MSGMMKNAEKIHRPSASNSINPKQMRRSKFGPGPVEALETENRAAAGGAPLFSYNLMDIPASPEPPAVQRKEPEDEEIQMKPSCPGCKEEEEAIQAKFVGEGIAPTVQRQTDPDSEEEEVLQGKFPPVQRTSKIEEEEPLQGRFESNALKTGPVQAKPEPNRTGMPDQLKAGIEALSGLDMSDVRVHYSSHKPAQLQALAYTQGTEIHVAPGQEKHLPHEAWHVAQQKQGRVRPTLQMKGVGINDDAGLEGEADVMGRRALQLKSMSISSLVPFYSAIQRKPKNINSHRILTVEKGEIINKGAERSGRSVARPVNDLKNKGVKDDYIGGHLFKREYGGPDNITNVVPWLKIAEDNYSKFEGKYEEATIKAAEKSQGRRADNTIIIQVEFRDVDPLHANDIKGNRNKADKVGKPKIAKIVTEAMSLIPHNVSVRDQYGNVVEFKGSDIGYIYKHDLEGLRRLVSESDDFFGRLESDVKEIENGQ
jgi:hypothetical protein